MDLKEAKYVLAIAKHKSISRAAESLFISQPSLSKYLKNLEVDASLSFQNIDNTAANARQAIKRFLKKWPGRKFSTKTCKEDHSFTIVRVK